MDAMSIILFVLIVWLSLKALPKLIGLSFSIFVIFLQVMLALILIPIIGMFIFLGSDTVILILLLLLISRK